MKIDSSQTCLFFSETLLFVAGGNLSGRVINQLDPILNPTMYSRHPPIDLNALTLFCASFIAIDNIAKKYLSNVFPNQSNQLPLLVSRLFISFQIADFLQRSMGKLVGYSALSSKYSLVVAASAIFFHVFFKQVLHSWDGNYTNTHE